MRNLLLSLLLSCCISKADAQFLKENDQNTRIDSMIHYELGVLEPIFFPKAKLEWKWHAPGKPLERIKYKMSYRDSSWIPFRRFTWSYHPLFDTETEETSWLWMDSIQAWKPFSRERSNYNVAAKVESILLEDFNSDKNEWETTSETEVLYNSAGERIRTVNTPAEGSQWIPTISTFDFVYGSNGELAMLNISFRDIDSVANIPILAINFSYGPDGKVLREEEFSVLANSRKQAAYSSLYDSQGRLIELVEDEGSNDGTQWITKRRRTFEFDQAGKFISESEESFNRQSQSWEQFAYWEIHGELFEEKAANYSSSLFEICPLPNPTTAEAPFVCSKLAANELYQLRVLDLQGRLVFEQEFAGDEFVYWAKGLSAGLYLLGIGPMDKALRYQKFVLE